VVQTTFSFPTRTPTSSSPQSAIAMASPAVTPLDYVITAEALGIGGAKTKYQRNVEAIKTLKQIQAEGRKATIDEQHKLVEYVGWGDSQLANAFNDRAAKWANEYKELQELLSDKEYKAARASTPNAHYTALGVIRAMWKAIGRLGFAGGKVLEPAAGVGHFFGLMPEEMRTKSKLYATELDITSGLITSQLYQSAEVKICGFEDADWPNNEFDLIVSNVPFGNYQITDPKIFQNGRSHLSGIASIHNYYFIKAMDLVRPGGLVVFITSKFTMDSKDRLLREYLSEKSALVGAIRLPVNAFEKNAGTHVTTDIIVLQKARDNEHRWIDALQMGEFRLNEYYVTHPEMMLGSMQVDNRRFQGVAECVPPAGQDLAAALEQAIQLLPEGIYTPRQAQNVAFKAVDIESEQVDIKRFEWLREGSYLIHDAFRVYQIENGKAVHQQLSGHHLRRMLGLIAVRDAFRHVLKANVEGASDMALRMHQDKLTHEYDLFVRDFGYLNEPSNARAFAADPDAPALLAIENYDRETKTATKADIFTKRTVGIIERPTSAETAHEAMAISLMEYGSLNWDRMTELTGKEQTELIAELGTKIFFDPDLSAYVTADEYLSGNVREKLNRARLADLQQNVEALTAVVPADLGKDDIWANLGASWIPDHYVQDFVNNHLFKDIGRGYYNRAKAKISYLRALGQWVIDLSEDYHIKWSSLNTSTWGTADMPAIKLIEQTLAFKVPTVYDTFEDANGYEQRVINQEKTIAAREKQEKIKEEFAKWIWADEARTTDLLTLYNREFNSLVPRRFDGSHLVFPGMNPNVTLRQHQKDGVWRIMQNRCTLLAWVVGAGKTYGMQAANMELRRLKLRHKPMHVIRNHMVQQYATEFRQLYPAANILVVDTADLSPAKRKQTLSRIATSDWDAIIVSHTGFGVLPLSPETKNDFIQEQIDMLTEHIEQMRGTMGHYGRDNKSVKELEKAKKRLEAKLEKNMSAGVKKDNGLTWEELGIDHLFVDECQYFKNLFFPTKMTRIPGVGGTEAGRAFDMFMKVRVMLKRENTGLTFATGTPISNSVSEMYTMQRYLQYDELQRRGLEHFDSWASIFGEVITLIEMKPDGSGFRQNRRFAKFNNVPELLRIFFQVADVKIDRDELGLDVPKLAGGKVHGVSVEPSEAQKAYINTLAERAENLKNVDPRDDNMLKIVSDGNKAALDMRLVDPQADDHPGSKVNAAVARIARLYHDTTNIEIPGQPGKHNLTQMVFLDLSTPKARIKVDEDDDEADPENTDATFMSVYDDMRNKLVEAGVKPQDIAFIHDAKTKEDKQRLFDRMNRGHTRILIGSTEKMGTGTNAQRLMVGMHHIDAPWKPAEVEQRDGRIIRQGNLCPEVYVYRYVTEQSLDVYRWQTIETKARFIAQVMRGDLTVRSIEDVDNVVIGYAEMKALATGNTAIMDKVKVDSDLRRLLSLRRTFANEQHEAQGQLYFRQDQIRRLESDIAAYQKLADRVKAEGDEPLVKLGTNLLGMVDLDRLDVWTVAELYGCRVEFDNRQTFKKEKDDPEAIKFAWGGGDGEIEVKKTGLRTVAIQLPDKSKVFKISVDKKEHANRNVANLAQIFGNESLNEEIATLQFKVEGFQNDIKNLKAKLNETFEHDGKIEQLKLRAIELQAEIDRIGKEDTTAAQAKTVEEN
jgi:N12 class adenine-specific DNA methylase